MEKNIVELLNSINDDVETGLIIKPWVDLLTESLDLHQSSLQFKPEQRSYFIIESGGSLILHISFTKDYGITISTVGKEKYTIHKVDEGLVNFSSYTMVKLLEALLINIEDICDTRFIEHIREKFFYYLRKYWAEEVREEVRIVFPFGLEVRDPTELHAPIPIKYGEVTLLTFNPYSVDGSAFKKCEKEDGKVVNINCLYNLTNLLYDAVEYHRDDILDYCLRVGKKIEV